MPFSTLTVIPLKAFFFIGQSTNVANGSCKTINFLSEGQCTSLVRAIWLSRILNYVWCAATHRKRVEKSTSRKGGTKSWVSSPHLRSEKVRARPMAKKFYLEYLAPSLGRHSYHCRIPIHMHSQNRRSQMLHVEELIAEPFHLEPSYGCRQP